MNMCLIVTRPEPEARRWVIDLAARGFQALALPLIQIGPVHDQTELTKARQQLAEFAGVMFVSANAVEHFFSFDASLAAGLGTHGNGRTRAWATGPGTAKALLRVGVAPERLDVPPSDASQFDSEALWQVVGPQLRLADRVLIVRGADASEGPNLLAGSGRDWFARKVAAAGAHVELVAAYQRHAPEFSADERVLARQAACDGSVWLFSSAQAVRNLQAAFPGQSWVQGRALATHARIADAARSAGFGFVCESRPTLPDVLAALESNDELRCQGTNR
jgi:uroporphyrinogen-III synthase